MTYTAMPIEELDALPRAAFIAAIEPLFEGAPALVERLAGDRPFGSWWNLLARARVVAHALPEPDRIAAHVSAAQDDQPSFALFCAKVETRSPT